MISSWYRGQVLDFHVANADRETLIKPVSSSGQGQTVSRCSLMTVLSKPDRVMYILDKDSDGEVTQVLPN